MSAKHTSGDWTYEFNPKFDIHPRVMATKNGERVCVASTIGTKTTRDKLTKREKIANATLIAAAPDLLEALIDLERQATFGTVTPERLSSARAAITKATGADPA